MNQSEAPRPLRVAMAQIRPRKADVTANAAHIQAVVGEHAGSTDLVVFPEAALSGYFLEGGVAESALTADGLAELLGPPPAEAPDVVVGFYERWRRRLYNSAAYLTPRDGVWAVQHVHRKMFLPTYGVFDEARFVEPGTALRAFDTRFGRFGLLICEEMWHGLPPTILALGGAELVVVVSASPARDFTTSTTGRPSNLDRWERLAPAVAEEHGIFVVVAQLVGSEGGKMFPGGSLAVGPDGSVLARGPLMEAGVTLVTLDPADIDRARVASPLLADLEQMLPHLQRSLGETLGEQEPDRTDEAGPPLAEDPPIFGGAKSRAPGTAPSPGAGVAMELDLDLVERALVEFLRDEFTGRRGFTKAVIGVSGGVDSAVSLYLACRAFGPENVHGFRLPYATSSQESLDHADLVLKATGAHAHTIEISASVDSYVATYEPDITPLRKGNLMARLRAVTLFDQSAKLHALPLGTGNKSERLLGYFTWHADDAPPINPLGDLFKTQVWALARHLGVPEVIVDKPATADLVRGVTDEDEMGIGYHDADPILHALVRGYTVDDLKQMGFDPHHVDLVWKRLHSTHWKRELPTVAVLSSSAIGEFYLRPVDY